MAKNNKMNSFFLSASIPSPERNHVYYETADIVAIRDAVRALATVIIPKSILVWGGHPSITPLIRYVLDLMNTNVRNHVTIYQSLEYEEIFPADNFLFENIVLTEKLGSTKESLDHMRERMLKESDFIAGIFVGGMDGVIEEYQLFKQMHPNALIIPVASTGAAARIIYNEYEKPPNDRLLTDYAYMSLFNNLLKDYI